MGFFLFLMYLITWFLFPSEIFPELIPYRIPFWLGVLGLVVSVFTLALTGKLTVRSLPVALVAGLVLSMMLSVVWADRWLGAPVHVIKEFGPVLTLFLLAFWNVNSLKRLHITGATLLLLAMLLAGQGVAAYHFGYMQDKFLLSQTGDADDDGESAGTDVQVRVRGLGEMNDPNDLALVLAAILPFLGLAWRKGRTVRNVLLLGLPASFLVYGIYLTRSRGGMLGILAACFAGLAGRVSRAKALVATAGMAAIFLAANFTGGRAVSSSEESAAHRIDAWSEGLDMFRSSPVLGVGFQNFTDHNDLTAHNSFVLCFAELGAVGYFFWLALLVVAILQMEQVRQCKDDGPGGDIAARQARVLIGSFAGVLAAAFFLSRSYNPVLYLLAGLAFALYGIARRSGYAVALPSLYRMSRKVAALEIASIAAIYILVRANRLLL
jgi:putative inorganic carbon (HCO3(-)) transporter